MLIDILRVVGAILTTYTVLGLLYANIVYKGNKLSEYKRIMYGWPFVLIKSMFKSKGRIK